MPAVHHGIETTEVYPQPGFKVTVGDKGSVTGHGMFAIRKEAASNPAMVARFNKGTYLADLDPDVDKGIYSFLQISKVDVAYVEGDLIFLDITFLGASGVAFPPSSRVPAAPAFVEYSMDMDTIELPLHEHPKWNNLAQSDWFYLGALMDGTYLYDIAANKLLIPTEDKKLAELTEEDHVFAGDAKEFAALIQQGKNTFDAPSVRWSATVDGALGNIWLSDLGKIDTPMGSETAGFPDVEDGQDWKFLGGTQSESMGVARTSFSWQLSPTLEGHNQFLYGQ